MCGAMDQFSAAVGEHPISIEIRASWSPIISDSDQMLAHIQAWCNLLGEVAGLPPIAEGVAPISAARRKA